MQNLEAIVARRSEIHVEKDIAVALIESYPHITNAMRIQSKDFDDTDSPEAKATSRRMTDKERFKDRCYEGYTKQEIEEEQEEEKYLDLYFEFPARFKDNLDLIEKEFSTMSKQALNKIIKVNEDQRSLLDKKYLNAAAFLNGMYFFNNV